MRRARRSMKEVPATTPESDALSRDLKKRAFRVRGGTIMYPFMQAVGLVADHVAGCLRARGRMKPFPLPSPDVQRSHPYYAELRREAPGSTPCRCGTAACGP